VHSRKPQLIRDKIVEMFGNELPKIELFARVKANGWDIWGNELQNDVELETSANNGR
jgi:N6-adenosine-specific RNA methylase IME4